MLLINPDIKSARVLNGQAKPIMQFWYDEIDVLILDETGRMKVSFYNNGKLTSYMIVDQIGFKYSFNGWS